MLEEVLEKWNAEWKTFLDDQRLAMVINLPEQKSNLLLSSRIYFADTCEKMHTLQFRGEDDLFEAMVFDEDEGSPYDGFVLSRDMKDILVNYTYSKEILQESSEEFNEAEAVFLANLFKKFKTQIIEASREIMAAKMNDDLVLLIKEYKNVRIEGFHYGVNGHPYFELSNGKFINAYGALDEISERETKRITDNSKLIKTP